MGRAGRIIAAGGNALHQTLLAQRGHLLGWVPVCLAIGIGIYFSLRSEPSVLALVALAALAAGLLFAARPLPEAVAPFPAAVALILAGLVLAGVRAHWVAGPVLDWRYYGPVEGRVIALDRSQSDALRLTLDRVRLERVPPDATPDRVRISLHGKGTQGITPEPGMRVMTTAHLAPPSGPVEPGGFDFQRHAWFEGLGAVGYARVPLMGVSAAEPGWAELLVFRLRMAASARVTNALPGDTGGFAAAITTGDRSAIGQDTLDDLRASNLAHLLAISGLHMGLLTALVLAALRVLLVAHPYTALHWPTKGIAAIGALIAAAVYLALSGGNVATQRAFIMVAVALGALVLGRRALSLRGVAVAATLVLALRPEALAGPGFQMSFAATAALVAVFGALRDLPGDGVPRWSRPVIATVVSSTVAGLATAPIAAAHFNAIAHYGLIANLLSVPLMGVLVMPAAILALVLAPIGLDWVGLWAMGLGLDWILGVARWIAAIEGARGYVVAPGGWVLPLLGLGFCWVVLWQGRLRWGGLAAILLAFALWQVDRRPDVLIADTGTLVGVMTPAGRALSKAKGAGFIARNWLENDGSGMEQARAAALWQETRILHLSGKRSAAAFEGCAPGQVVVSSVPVSGDAAKGCQLFDPPRLRQTGAVALRRDGSGWQITTARQIAGDRLWTQWPDAPRRTDQ